MKERDEIGFLLKSFILFDVIFVVTFCVVGFLEYANNAAIIILIVGILISYYPLYIYVREYNSNEIVRTKHWHLKYINTALFYFVSRVIVLLGFFVIALVHLTDIDIIHDIQFFSILTKVALIVMSVCLLCLFMLVWVVAPHHRHHIKDEITVANVTATVIYTGSPREVVVQNAFKSTKPLKLHNATDVILTPHPTAENLTRPFTILANQ